MDDFSEEELIEIDMISELSQALVEQLNNREELLANLLHNLPKDSK